MALPARGNDKAATEPTAGRSVAIVPASEPGTFPVVHRSTAQFLIPLVATATHLDSKQKTQDFSALLKARTPDYGAYFTQQVRERLQALGYRTTLLADVARPADAPDDIEYEKLAFQADLALQIRIDEMGFYAGFGSPSYVPKVNVTGISFTRGGKQYPYEGSIHYGADAKPGKDWAIESPASANFATFDALMADPNAAHLVFRDALQRAAERLVAQFDATERKPGAAAK